MNKKRIDSLLEKGVLVKDFSSTISLTSYVKEDGSVWEKKRFSLLYRLQKLENMVNKAVVICIGSIVGFSVLVAFIIILHNIFGKFVADTSLLTLIGMFVGIIVYMSYCVSFLVLLDIKFYKNKRLQKYNCILH